jgi:hypothetical protein
MDNPQYSLVIDSGSAGSTNQRKKAEVKVYVEPRRMDIPINAKIIWAGEEKRGKRVTE